MKGRESHFRAESKGEPTSVRGYLPQGSSFMSCYTFRVLPLPTTEIEQVIGQSVVQWPVSTATFIYQNFFKTYCAFLLACSTSISATPVERGHRTSLRHGSCRFRIAMFVEHVFGYWDDSQRWRGNAFTYSTTCCGWFVPGLGLASWVRLFRTNRWRIARKVAQDPSTL
jgi:hypothetical protein